MVNIAIIGFGRIGKIHFENFIQIPNVEITHVVDLFTENARKWLDEHHPELRYPANHTS